MLSKILSFSLIASKLTLALPTDLMQPRAALPVVDCSQFPGDAIYEWFTFRNYAWDHNTNVATLDLNTYAFPGGGYDTQCTGTVTPGGFVFHACDNPAIPTTFAVGAGGGISNRIAFSQKFACKSPTGAAPIPTVVETDHEITTCWNGNVQTLCWGVQALPGEMHAL